MTQKLPTDMRHVADAVRQLPQTHVDTVMLQCFASEAVDSGTLFVASPSMDGTQLRIISTSRAFVQLQTPRKPFHEIDFSPTSWASLKRCCLLSVVGAYDPLGVGCHALDPTLATHRRITIGWLIDAIEAVGDRQARELLQHRGDPLRRVLWRLNRPLAKPHAGFGGPTGTWAAAIVAATAVDIVHRRNPICLPAVPGWTIVPIHHPNEEIVSHVGYQHRYDIADRSVD